MVAPLCAILVLVLMWVAETLHQRRVTSLASLAFGPDGKPAFLGRVLPWLKAPAAALATWGLLVLATMPPKVHPPEEASEGEIKHVMMILDVSPSMQLIDAGKEGMISRRKQCATLMQSFFRRVIMEQVRLSVIAVYTGAKPVVVDTRDVEVVRNILNDLPMSHAFDPGQTQLFSGLEEAIGICHPWAKDSTTLVILSDGDTLPAIGMPRLPPSVSDVLVVGVGDPRQGSFINGYQSKQESSTLRQMAARLGGGLSRWQYAPHSIGCSGAHDERGKGGFSHSLDATRTRSDRRFDRQSSAGRHPLSSGLGRHALSARRAG